MYKEADLFHLDMDVNIAWWHASKRFPKWHYVANPTAWIKYRLEKQWGLPLDFDIPYV